MDPARPANEQRPANGHRPANEQRPANAHQSGDGELRFLHVDMDAFYASVEVLDDPSLAGLPLIVGGPGSRGVVASCSYEARRFGVRSAMPSVEARRRCPWAVFRPGRFDRYAELSARLHEILTSFTPLVEGIALDEAFLDVAGASRLFGPPETVAATIRARVLDELGLYCSVGVASTMVLAKLASKAAKPRATAEGVTPGPGVFVVAPGEELEFLHPMPVRALWGVGPVTARRLGELGIKTVGDLAALSPASLETAVGRAHGRHLHALARGVDPRRVVPERVAKSIGHEETYAHDRYDRDELAREVVRMADAVSARLRAHPVSGRTVTLKIRYGDFTTLTRSRTLEAPTDLARDIAVAATLLLDGLDLAPGVRLLGVSMTNLVSPAPDVPETQLSLPLDPAVGSQEPPGGGDPRDPVRDEHSSWVAASNAIDEVRQRYGSRALGPASLLDEGGLRLRRLGDAPWGPGGGGRPTPERDESVTRRAREGAGERSKRKGESRES
ncbi:MAG: DNA polymerase IV [Acidimicrobiaceae bacterium]|nr:DNA polymerase IV [Acidimicrobiaceae bacterium]